MLSRMLPLRLDGNLQKSGLHTSQHLNKPSFGEAWIRAWETGKQQTNKRRARSGEAADSVGDAFGPRAPETERVNRLGLCSSLLGWFPPPRSPRVSSCQAPGSSGAEVTPGGPAAALRDERRLQAGGSRGRPAGHPGPSAHGELKAEHRLCGGAEGCAPRTGTDSSCCSLASALLLGQVPGHSTGTTRIETLGLGL